MVKSSYQQKLIFSLVYFFSAVLLLTAVSFAWFTLTNTNRAFLEANVSGVEAEYEFYIYNDEFRDGLQLNPFLTNNVCINPNDLDCYLFIPNPAVAYLIPTRVAPGDRFSFAIKIANIGTTEGKLSIIFGGINSIGHDLSVNKIQTAFYYEVTKIAYVNAGIESTDQKDLPGFIYNNQYFLHNQTEDYLLVRNIPVLPVTGNDSVVILFFDLFFDPTIYGFDTLGEPLLNSNIFRNQMFTVNTVYMTLNGS